MSKNQRKFRQSDYDRLLGHSKQLEVRLLKEQERNTWWSRTIELLLEKRYITPENLSKVQRQIAEEEEKEEDEHRKDTCRG